MCAMSTQKTYHPPGWHETLPTQSKQSRSGTAEAGKLGAQLADFFLQLGQVMEDGN